MCHNLAWFDVGGSFLATPTVSMHFGGPIFSKLGDLLAFCSQQGVGSRQLNDIIQGPQPFEGLG